MHIDSHSVSGHMFPLVSIHYYYFSFFFITYYLPTAATTYFTTHICMKNWWRSIPLSLTLCLSLFRLPVLEHLNIYLLMRISLVYFGYYANQPTILYKSFLTTSFLCQPAYLAVCLVLSCFLPLSIVFNWF